MRYQVLARKWRPKTFSDVVGQEHVLTALANSLLLGRIHDAYLFSGTRGVGKTTIARLLAKGLNCETGITSTPCGQCKNCQEIELVRFIDLIEIDAASRTKVEDTRELLDNVQYAPASGRFKVYLIDEVHMLSRHSFNALLKTLEEPPSHVKFLLATTEPKKLPATILSRCLQFHLKALNVDQIRNQLAFVLQKEQFFAEPRALQQLASAAKGSMRDALSLTDQSIAMGQGKISAQIVNLMLGTLNIEQPLALIESLADANGVAMMTQLEQYAALGMDWESLLVEMLALLHRLALDQLVQNQLNNEVDPANIIRLRDLARRLPPADLQLYYQILLIGRKELPFAPDYRMGVEMTLLRALAFHPAAEETVKTSHTIKEKKIVKFSANMRQDNLATVFSTASCGPNSSTTRYMSTRLTFHNINRVNDNAAMLEQDVSEQASFFRAICTSQQKTMVNIKNKRASHSDRSDKLGPGCVANSRRGISNTTAYNSLISDQTLLSPGNLRSSRINVDKENLMYACFASGFNDKKKAHGDWQKNVIPSDNKYSLKNCALFSNVDIWLLNVTAQLLHVRTNLFNQQMFHKTKKDQPATAHKKTAIPALKLLSTLSESTQQRQPDVSRKQPTKPLRQEESHSRSIQQLDEDRESLTTTQALHISLDQTKPLSITLCLSKELLTRDPWAAQVNRLVIPQLVQQLALNAWKENLAPGKVCLHLRASQRNLNSTSVIHTLRAALSSDFGAPIELTIIEDNNLAMKTPLEWCQAIYEEKLILAREAIMHDEHVHMMQFFFDAELDEASILPL